MNIAYIRVSTKEQNTGRQIEAMKAHNIGRIYEEKVSGKDTNRPQLKAMLEYAREGDTVYVESFSRLARNMLDLLTIIDQLTKKNVGFVSLKENIDTTTPAGRLQLNVFGAIYQFERECSKERQREGIDLALAENRPYGRPKIEIDDLFLRVYKQWKNKEITAVKAIELTGMKKNTFYNRVKELEKSSNKQNDIIITNKEKIAIKNNQNSDSAMPSNTLEKLINQSEKEQKSKSLR